MLTSTVFKFEPWDEQDFRAVAQAVILLNPYHKGSNIDGLAENMLRIAEREIGTKPGYVATGGWMVTSCHEDGDPNAPMVVRASIASSLVRYIPGWTP